MANSIVQLHRIRPTRIHRVHVVQQRPDSYPCSVSGQVSGGHMTPLQLAGPLALAPMPPLRSLVHERSSGALIASLQQMAQQVPASAAVLISKGGIHWTAGHSVPAQGSLTPCWISNAFVRRARTLRSTAKVCMLMRNQRLSSLSVRLEK